MDTSVANAHTILVSRIRRNKVRQDYMANMRHEKKGVKRRRLESERWRRRFADHVRSVSQQVVVQCLTSPIPEHRSGKRFSSSKRSDDEAPKHACIHMVFYHTHPFHKISTIRWSRQNSQILKPKCQPISVTMHCGERNYHAPCQSYQQPQSLSTKWYTLASGIHIFKSPQILELER